MNMRVPRMDPMIEMPQTALDHLLPMHLQIDPAGIIQHVGPTCAKLGDGTPFAGRALLDVFSIRRPNGVKTLDDLLKSAMTPLALTLKWAEHLPFRGVIVPLADGGGAVMNLSFGLSFAKAVSEFSLTLTDFSATDQTVELLYLNEARASTTQLSEHLTQRLQNAHSTAQQQARTDVLTGLSNRRAIDDELGHLIANRTQDFTLMHLDLDLFKQVNDTYGHAAGDAVLVEIGRILNQEMRRNDFPGRIGGDEFLIILRPSPPRAVVKTIAKRIIRLIEEPIEINDVTVRISASIGVASTDDYEARPRLKELMSDVDEALYAAKRAGRGRVMVSRPTKNAKQRTTD